MGPFIYCLATQTNDQLLHEIPPKLCVVIEPIMKYSRGHLAIPMGHMYSDLLEINKNNMNGGHFLNTLVIKKKKEIILLL